ncbi:MAG: TIGR00730 family Rossman fold protein [Thermoguttaceae bacterium]
MVKEKNEMVGREEVGQNGNRSSGTSSSSRHRVCVYCASSALVDPLYFDATKRLARELVLGGFEVVYGGGAIGLMGHLADSVLSFGGQIKGIIPKFMDEVEWTHPGLCEVIFTETMHERKAKFLEGVDGLVALPGGTGTLEELFEAMTLKRLGLFGKPIVLLNTNQFYAPLIEMLQKCVSERFMKEKHLSVVTVVNQPEEVVPTILATPDWDKNAIHSAVVR